MVLLVLSRRQFGVPDDYFKARVQKVMNRVSFWLDITGNHLVDEFGSRSSAKRRSQTGKHGRPTDFFASGIEHFGFGFTIRNIRINDGF